MAKELQGLLSSRTAHTWITEVHWKNPVEMNVYYVYVCVVIL